MLGEAGAGPSVPVWASPHPDPEGQMKQHHVNYHVLCHFPFTVCEFLSLGEQPEKTPI